MIRNLVEFVIGSVVMGTLGAMFVIALVTPEPTPESVRREAAAMRTMLVRDCIQDRLDAGQPVEGCE